MMWCYCQSDDYHFCTSLGGKQLNGKMYVYVLCVYAVCVGVVFVDVLHAIDVFVFIFLCANWKYTQRRRNK